MPRETVSRTKLWNEVKRFEMVLEFSRVRHTVRVSLCGKLLQRGLTDVSPHCVESLFLRCLSLLKIGTKIRLSLKRQRYLSRKSDLDLERPEHCLSNWNNDNPRVPCHSWNVLQIRDCAKDCGIADDYWWEIIWLRQYLQVVFKMVIWWWLFRFVRQWTLEQTRDFCRPLTQEMRQWWMRRLTLQITSSDVRKTSVLSSRPQKVSLKIG